MKGECLSFAVHPARFAPRDTRRPTSSRKRQQQEAFGVPADQADVMWQCTAGVTEVQIGQNRASVVYLGNHFARQAVTTIDARIAIAHASQECTTLLNAENLRGTIALFDATICSASITGLLAEQSSARAVIIVMPSTGDGASESVGSPWTEELRTEWDARLCDALSTDSSIPVLIASNIGDAAMLRAAAGTQGSLTIGGPF